MNRIGYALVSLLAFAVAAYAIVAYAFLPVGSAVHPSMRETFESQRGVVLAHAFGSAVALLLGPLQFHAGLRARQPRLHRWLGRTYLGAGVGLGGMAGLFLAASAQGGMAGKLGFAALALAWLYTAVHALGAAQQRDFVAHRAWMIRNFALTFAAVTLRLWLPGSALAGIPFERAYPAIAWLCWVPNLLVAEAIVRRLFAPHVAAAPR